MPNNIPGIPVTEIISLELFSLEYFQLPDEIIDQLSNMLVTNYESIFDSATNKGTISIGLSVEQELVLDLAIVSGLAFVIGGPQNSTLLLSKNVHDDNIDYLIGAGARLRFSKDYLKPVVKTNEKWVPDTDREYAEIIIQAGIIVSSDWDVDFDGSDAFELLPSMIGDTGCVIEGSLAIDFSRDRALPESVSAGLDATWQGVVFKELLFHLPSDIDIPLSPSSLGLENFHIGTGGLQGSIVGIWDVTLSANRDSFEGVGSGCILGFPAALVTAEIEIIQNTFSTFNVETLVILPFFDQPVQCKLKITDSGDITLGLSSSQILPDGVEPPEVSEDGLFIFTKEELFKLKLQSIAFKKQADIFSVQLGGAMQPLIGDLDWPVFDINLDVDSRGRVSVDGGWMTFPNHLSMNFNGFGFEITKMGFGNDNDWRWVGLSGGITIVEGLPLKGGVEGLKIKWTDGGDIDFEMAGIQVAFEIENVLTFDGKVSFFDEPPKKGFKGGLKMSFEALGSLAMDMQFKAGCNAQAPSYSFAYCYVSFLSPVGIPLGASGAALFGVDLVAGINVTVTKGLPPNENEAWYENEDDPFLGFYKRTPIGITDEDKWIDKRDAFAFGGGVTLGTLSDLGYSFNSKVLLIVLVPGPVIMIEGKANLMQELAKGASEPMFRLLAVLDSQAGTLELNISALYKYPKTSGDVIEISGTAESFFSFNGGPWYVYIGRKEPTSKRIRADIIKFLKANSYFMIEPDRILMGAWAGIDERWKYGPLSVHITISVLGELVVTFKPAQATGRIEFIGDAGLKAFGIGIGLSVYAMAMATVPTPWEAEFEIKVKLKLCWPLDDVGATLKWGMKEHVAPPLPVPLVKIGAEHLKVSEKWELEKFPVYDTDGDGFRNTSASSTASTYEQSPVLPLDARLSLGFSLPVSDHAEIGINSASDPVAELIDDYKYKYQLKRVVLHKRPKTNASSWQLVSDINEGVQNGEAVLFGAWQAVAGEGPTNKKLLIYANNPFEIVREQPNNRAYRLDVVEHWENYPCSLLAEPETVCADFDALPGKSVHRHVLAVDDVLLAAEDHIQMRVYPEATWAGTQSYITPVADKYTIYNEAITFDGLSAGNEHHLTINRVKFKTLDYPNQKTALHIGDQYPVQVDKNGVRDFSNELWSGIPKFIADKLETVDDDNQILQRLSLDAALAPGKGDDVMEIQFPIEHFPQGVNEVKIDLVYVGDTAPRFRSYKKNGDANNSVFANGPSQKVVSITLKPNTPIERIVVSDAIVGILNIHIQYRIPPQNNLPHLTIIFPENVGYVELSFVQGSKGRVCWRDSSNASIAQENFDVLAATPDSNMKPIVFRQDDLDEEVRDVLIIGDIKLAKICYVTSDEQSRVQQNEIYFDNTRTAIEERWSHTAPLFEPDHYYKLTTETKVCRQYQNNSWENHYFTEHAYFQTEGPPGVHAGPLGVDEDGVYPRGGPLNDLSEYIFRSIPEQVATNEPMIPVYCSYDTGIVFNEARGYVETMYISANKDLTIRLFDNNADPVHDINGNALVMNNMWSANPELVATREEILYLQFVDENCNRITVPEHIETSDSLLVNSPGFYLKPQTFYKAKVFAGETHVVYEYTFLTSRYSNFVHHVQSFANAVWDWQALEPSNARLDVQGKLDLAVILADIAGHNVHTPPLLELAPQEGMISFVSDEAKLNNESIAFEQLTQLFGLNQRPLPEKLEIMLLSDKNENYGILIESPEPIDAKRTVFALEYIDDTTTVIESVSPVKIMAPIIRQSEDDPVALEEESIDLILQYAFDLSGYKVLLKYAGEDDYIEHFSFDEGEKHPAGTIIKIFSGLPVDMNTREYEPRFARKAGDVLDLVLDPVETTIALQNSDGDILDEYMYVGITANWTETVLIRNKDNTRAFIFLPDGQEQFSELADGRYCLLTAFERKWEGVKNISRFGSTDLEISLLEFTLPPQLPLSL